MIDTLFFGRTGHESTRIIFGAAALAAMRQPRADALLQTLAEAGLNHIDTAARYGESELRLAPFLKAHRDEVFLATKTGERGYEGARDELRRSLDRMGVDHVDLIQLHNLVDTEGQQEALREGGALQALVEARDEGLVRHIGVTGHGTIAPAAHLRSLETFAFDSVLFPYNPTMMADARYAREVDELMAHCRQHGVAMQTIKALSRRRWRPDDDSKRYSWYEPIRDPDAIARLVHWVLATDDVFLNTTSDATLLPAVLEAAAAGGDRPSEEALRADEAALGIEPLFVRGQLEGVG